MKRWITLVPAATITTTVAMPPAAATTITPLDQTRTTLAHVTTECEGSTEQTESAPGFAAFDSDVATFQSDSLRDLLQE